MFVFAFNLFLNFFLLSGKSGHVAARLAGTLSSIGIPAHYVPATEWSHGDLGMGLCCLRYVLFYLSHVYLFYLLIQGKLQPTRDVCIFLSHSGSTSETVRAASQVLGKGVITWVSLGTQVYTIVYVTEKHLSVSIFSMCTCIVN